MYYQDVLMCCFPASAFAGGQNQVPKRIPADHDWMNGERSLINEQKKSRDNHEKRQPYFGSA